MPNELFFECKIMIDKLKRIKKERNLTYQEIGEAIEVNRSHVYRIFNNLESSPSLNVLVKMARFLEVPLYSLFIPSGDYEEEFKGNRVLEMFSKEVDHIGINLQQLQMILFDLGLKETQQGHVLNYVLENINGKLEEK